MRFVVPQANGGDLKSELDGLFVMMQRSYLAPKADAREMIQVAFDS